MELLCFAETECEEPIIAASLKGLLLLLIAGLSYSLSMLVSLPATFAWKQIEMQLPAEPQRGFDLSGLNGTLWDGAALLQLPFLEAPLKWRVQWLGLAGGALPLHFDAEERRLKLAGQSRLGLGGDLELEASGWLSAELLAPVLERNRIELEGRIELQSLRIESRLDQQWPQHSEGLLSYAGGEVRFPLGRQMKRSEVPPLRGLLSQNGENLQLDVNTATDNANLVVIVLEPNGTARVEVRKRLLDTLNIPYGKAASAGPDTVVFKVRQRLGR